MSITVLKTPVVKVNEEVIEELKELLKRAEAGEFVAFAWVASLPDGSIKTAWTNQLDFHSLLSGAALLQFRLAEARVRSSEAAEEK